MEYLVVLFLIIIIIGLLANRELAHDRKRIRQTIREYSFKRCAGGDESREEGGHEGPDPEKQCSYEKEQK